MTPEKRKELLHYAADNPDARFKNQLQDQQNEPIRTVLEYPEYDWEIVKEPVVTVEYYKLEIVNAGSGKLGYIDCHKNNWDLRITTTGGVRVAEFRENIK